MPPSLNRRITVDSTNSCTASTLSGSVSPGDQRWSAKGCPASFSATVKASFSSKSLGRIEIACWDSSPSNIISDSPSGTPNGLGDLTTTRIVDSLEITCSISWATPTEWRGCNSWASSITNRVLWLAAEAAIAEAFDRDSPSHISPIAEASVSIEQEAQRTVQPLLMMCSVTSLARLDLPTPGSPLSSTLVPPVSIAARSSDASSLPCRTDLSGSGP